MTHKLGKILLAVFSWFMAGIGVILVFLCVSEAVTDGSARVLPSYPKEDLTSVLQKEVLSEEDYEFLYRQTGVGRRAIEAFSDRTALLKFQEALFDPGTLKHSLAAFSTPHDYLEKGSAPLIPLEDGDVIVTSSCHTFGWRNGHAGIVVDALFCTSLESVAPGEDSCFCDMSFFTSASNFLILRLKGVSAERRAEIALNASRELVGVPYSLAVGIFMPKDQGTSPKATNCSHLVWQAFKNAGYDIDSDKGPVCTARDIAKCDLFDVVQVYGFDPLSLW